MSEQSGRGTPAWYDEPGTAFLPKTPAEGGDTVRRIAEIERRLAKATYRPDWPQYEGQYWGLPADIAWLLAEHKRQRELLAECVEALELAGKWIATYGTVRPMPAKLSKVPVWQRTAVFAEAVCNLLEVRRA